jgi:hypothetical protein
MKAYGLLVKEEEGVLLFKLGYVFPNKGEDNVRELKRSADVNTLYEEKDSDNFNFFKYFHNNS